MRHLAPKDSGAGPCFQLTLLGPLFLGGEVASSLTHTSNRSLTASDLYWKGFLSRAGPRRSCSFAAGSAGGVHSTEGRHTHSEQAGPGFSWEQLRICAQHLLPLHGAPAHNVGFSGRATAWQPGTSSWQPPPCSNAENSSRSASEAAPQSCSVRLPEDPHHRLAAGVTQAEASWITRHPHHYCPSPVFTLNPHPGFAQVVGSLRPPLILRVPE